MHSIFSSSSFSSYFSISLDTISTHPIFTKWFQIQYSKYIMFINVNFQNKLLKCNDCCCCCCSLYVLNTQLRFNSFGWQIQNKLDSLWARYKFLATYILISLCYAADSVSIAHIRSSFFLLPHLLLLLLVITLLIPLRITQFILYFFVFV